MVQSMPCATIIFCVDVRGIPVNPEEPGDPVAGFVELEVELMALVRSRVRVPEPRCCCKLAFTAEESGFVVPNAQMISCWVSEFAY